jgi:hypothetical protein
MLLVIRAGDRRVERPGAFRGSNRPFGRDDVNTTEAGPESVRVPGVPAITQTDCRGRCPRAMGFWYLLVVIVTCARRFCRPNSENETPPGLNQSKHRNPFMHFRCGVPLLGMWTGGTVVCFFVKKAYHQANFPAP